MKYRHYFAAMTAAALLLTGCQQINTPAPEKDSSAQMLAETMPAAPDTTPLTNIVRFDPVALPGNVGCFWMAERTADGFGCIALDMDGKESYLHISEDLQTAEANVLTPPAAQDGFTLYNRWFALGDSEIWAIAILESHGDLKPYDPQTDDSSYDWDSWDAAEQKQYLLCRYAENGTLVSAVPADELADYRNFAGGSAYDQFQNFDCAGGVLYLTLDDGRVLQIDKETAAISVVSNLHNQEDPYSRNTLYFDRDNKPLLLQVQEGPLTPDGTDYVNQYTLSEYDLASGTCGQVIYSYAARDNGTYVSVQKGSGEYRLFVDNCDELIGIRDDGSLEHLIDIDGSDLLNTEIVPIDDAHFLGFQYLDSGRTEVYRLTRKHESEIMPTEVLTIGVLGDPRSDPELYALAKEFNRTHEGYRIEFKEYPVNYDSDETIRSSEETFRQALQSDQAPDIVMLRSHDEAVTLGKQGVFLDLRTLMDKDVLFGRDKFVSNVLTALEAPDGSLYGMPRTFYVSTIAVKKKFCDKENWTLDDLFALYENADGDVYRWQTRSLMIWELLAGMRLTDADGHYQLDQQDFIRLLEFIQRFPESTDPLEDSYANKNDFYTDEFLSYTRDEALLSGTSLYGMGSTMACGYSYAKYHTFGGEDITLVGYPSADGHGGKIRTDQEIAVSAHSQHPEIAWEFVKTYLQQARREGDALPVLNDRFEQELDACTHIHTYENETEPPYYVDDGVKVYPLTQEEREDVERYIRSCTETLSPHSLQITDIICDQAEMYFSGDLTAEEAAENVRKQAESLLAEQP